MKIKVTADRMIDLSFEELERLNITTMPCFINMGNKSYNDLDDVFPIDIIEYFESTGKLAQTAAKSPDHYVEFFQPLLEDCDAIVHLACSSGISSISDNAKIASTMLGNRVYCVDTKILSNGIAIIAKHAVARVEEGVLTAEQIQAECLELLHKVRGSFLIDDLVYLYKGGRCKALSFYAANILRIKPVIYLDHEGRMKVREKIKGSRERALVTYIKNSFTKEPPILEDIYFSMSLKDEEKERLVKSILDEMGYKFKNIYFNTTSCNCCVHSGRNVIGMFYLGE